MPSHRSLLRSAVLVAVLVAVLAVGACGGADGAGGGAGAGTAGGGDDRPAAGDAAPAAAVIRLEGTKFEPAEVTVSAGELVRWEWAGSVQHDVAGGSFKSPVKSKGHYDHRFTTAGTFAYRCNVHPGMKGVVEVEP